MKYKTKDNEVFKNKIAFDNICLKLHNANSFTNSYTHKQCKIFAILACIAKQTFDFRAFPIVKIYEDFHRAIKIQNPS